MYNTLGKFMKGKHNLNIILGNHRAIYDKFNLGFEPKNNVKFFNKTFHANKTGRYNMSKYIYCEKFMQIHLNLSI